MNYKKKYKNTALYKETMVEYKNFKWWPTENIMGNNVFILTRKIYDVEKGDLGVLVIHVSVDIMNDIYRIVSNEKKLQMFLIYETGMILYHIDKKPDWGRNK